MTLGCHSLPPLKESRPEIRVGVLLGQAKGETYLKWVLYLLRQTALRMSFSATSEGSPFNFSFISNLFYFKIIFLKFRFEGQEEGLGMNTYQFP